MAVPVITTVTIPTTAVAGTPITLTAAVTDPGASTVTVTAVATNQATGEASAPASGQVAVTDPIVVAWTCDDPSAQITVAADGTATLLFP